MGYHRSFHGWFAGTALLVAFNAMGGEGLFENKQRELAGEKLYNGIVLPVEWPPGNMDPNAYVPMPVPYLEQPPEVIPIDVGRQLFVDDFLIAETTLERVYHKPEPYADNPVLKAETPFETSVKPRVGLQQGGLFWNPEKARYELFYHSGTLAPRHRHLAYSRDLIHWERPDFGEGQGNRFREPGPSGEALSPDTPGSLFAVWLDLDADDPAERYKMFAFNALSRGSGSDSTHLLYVSADGIHWSKPTPAGPAEDAQSLIFNPFRDVWVYSIKRKIRPPIRPDRRMPGRIRNSLRARWYAESPDFLSGGDWNQAVYWTCADHLDVPEPPDGYPAYPHPGARCQLYILHGAAYESIMLGMFEIHRGPNNQVCKKGKFPKLTDLEMGFSRDGFHWHRPDRSGFIRGSRRIGDWDCAYLHGTTSVLVIHDDHLVFPYAGYSGVDQESSRRGMYEGGAIGLAMLRRDGFASMNAGATVGTLTTRPLTFNGSHLFVNAAVREGGALRAELLDRDGQVIAPFTLEQSVPFTGDQTRVRLEWKHGNDLSALAGRPVRLRFTLADGSLYAFWVSGSERGESGGYVAGGGPEFSGNRDVAR